MGLEKVGLYPGAFVVTVKQIPRLEFPNPFTKAEMPFFPQPVCMLQWQATGTSGDTACKVFQVLEGAIGVGFQRGAV